MSTETRSSRSRTRNRLNLDDDSRVSAAAASSSSSSSPFSWLTEKRVELQNFSSCHVLELLATAEMLDSRLSAAAPPRPLSVENQPFPSRPDEEGPCSHFQPTRTTSERYAVMDHGHPCASSPLSIPSLMRAFAPWQARPKKVREMRCGGR